MRRTVLTNIFIFLFVLIVYLLFNQEWSFAGEDYGLIWRACQCTSLRDLLNFFINGNVIYLSQPIITSKSLATELLSEKIPIFYRPLTLIIHNIQYHLFGLNAYAYFVFIIVIHALNTLILFNLLSRIISRRWVALASSLLFAFHPTLYGWFGKIDTQQNVINLFFALMCTITFVSSMQQGSKARYLLSCIFLLLCLLLRETFIILPFIFLVGLFIFDTVDRYYRFALGLFVSPILYLLLRCYLHPPTLSFSSEISHHYSFHVLVAHVTSLAMFFKDLFWLQWFPWKTYLLAQLYHLHWLYQVAKIFILAIIGTLFFTNTQKKNISFIILTAAMVLWPLIFVTSGAHRYSYEALPLYVTALAFIINFSKPHSKILNQFIHGMAAIILIVSLVFSSFLTICAMRQSVVIPQQITYAIERLVITHAHLLHNRPLFVFNDQASVACGILQAINLYDISTGIPQYFCCNISINKTVPAEKVVKCISVEIIPDGIRLKSHDPEHAWFTINNEVLLPPYLKAIAINGSTDSNKLVDISLIFGKKYFDSQIIPLALFREEAQFVVIETNKAALPNFS